MYRQSQKSHKPQNCSQDQPYINLNVQPDILSLSDLQRRMTAHNNQGDAFLRYLLEGDFFEGKGIWVNDNDAVRSAYERVLAANPELESESPFGNWFNRDQVRRPGENDIILESIDTASEENRAANQAHRNAVADGLAPERVVVAGGPAAKVAAILLSMQPAISAETEVMFVYDGGEQSNESASASYEHINHANALNAEHDNSGLAIAGLCLKRALFGESDPSVALDVDYHKVDLWPSGFAFRDLPIYVRNELHGRIQSLKSFLGIKNDHDKSRLASLHSTHILSEIERVLDVSLRIRKEEPSSFFLYLSPVEHHNSYREHRILKRFVGLEIIKVPKDTLKKRYGDISNIISGDIIRENGCIRHGFDNICKSIILNNDGKIIDRALIKKIYFDKNIEDHCCVAIEFRDLRSGELVFLPVDRLGLSLGPTATYRFADDPDRPWRRIMDRFGISQPVPRQTIATGFSGQLLFRINDHDRFRTMPQTGLKQTHFVEIGRFGDDLLLKLTSGGNIGLPVYSRSYALGALANTFRVLKEGCGLDFIDVVCAWPGLRGVNGPNNGQLVQLAHNCVVRFGEGGTGMSKMGTNAQVILDMLDLPHGLSEEISLPKNLYAHTILDRCNLVRNRIRN